MRTPFALGLCPLFVGLFAAVSAAAAPPAETVARQVLVARQPSLAALSLGHRDSLPLSKGRTLVRFAQSHAGLPVVSRGASALLDAKGAPTAFAASKVEERFPSSSTPALDAGAAAHAAELAVQGATFDAKDARLAWLPGPRGARLVWMLYRGTLPGTPYAPLVAIDAQRGSIVLKADATRFDRQASVFNQNPVTTPTQESVTLDTLPVAATKLESDTIRSLTCVDNKSLVGKQQIHMCDLVPKALADAQGDFPYQYVSDTAPEDEFAEVSMFYHATRAYAFFQGLGMPELDLKPLVTVANLRFPPGWATKDLASMKNPDMALEPYDNAFFTPQNPFYGMFKDVPGGLFFGQGTAADFAYDGDVVYHELGHAMVDRTVQLVPYWHFDSQGAAPQPGAMNEGLADYFSSAITGDSKVGEYASKNVGYGYAGNDAIRDLDNLDACPKNIAGEVHVDSTLFSGGLWKVRQALPEADRTSYDQALFTALLGAPSGNLGYADLAKLFQASLEASSLGSSVATALQTEFETRGVLPECARVLEYKGQPLSSLEWKVGNGFYAPGKPYVGIDSIEPYAPGLLQVHRTLPATAEKLRVAWTDIPTTPELGGQGDPYTPALLVRFAKDPIVFEGALATNADGPFSVSGGFAPYYEMEIPKGATDVWVMVVNLGDEQGLYRELILQTKSAPTNTGGTSAGGSGGSGAVASGGNPASGGGAQAEDSPALHPVGGCSTRGPSRQSEGGAFGMLVLGALLALRRRRH